ncbi:uncharacterized protein [Diadema antillarum]|uniref:uncharacterized protein n=1 Tax=Diadema antillarum TaxID=105358 RepID=UPI003A84B853
MGKPVKQDKEEVTATVKRNFARISERIAELQINHAEWKKLVTSKKEFDLAIDGCNTSKSTVYDIIRVLIGATLVIVSGLFLFFALCSADVIPEESFLGSVHYGLSKFIVETVDGAELDEEKCIIPFHEALQDLFRPPVDCNMCLNMTSIDTRVDLSPEEFKERYAYSGRPLHVTDGMAGWTAVETFSFGYFKKIYTPGSQALNSSENDCQFFPYRTNFEKLGDVFEMTEDEAYLRDDSNKKPWYVGWSNCDSAAANMLRKHYKKPYFLPEDSESSRVDWIFMGSPGYGAPNHIDAVDLPSWQAQVKGHKIWTLTPPPECYFQCGSSMDVTLHPGSIIIVDTNSWFHSTKVVGDEMSITIGSEYD